MFLFLFCVFVCVFCSICRFVFSRLCFTVNKFHHLALFVVWALFLFVLAPSVFLRFLFFVCVFHGQWIDVPFLSDAVLSCAVPCF